MADFAPFNIDDLINLRSFEHNRVEYKATWNDAIRPAVVRTICAFANDLLNLNGGYIVLGVEESGGRPQLPPRGLDDLDIDLVQKEIRGACFQIQPNYFPILFPENYQGKAILIAWAPGGDNRPYQCPEEPGAKGSPAAYFVRQGPQTVQAKGEIFRQLMEAAAKVPFDDRRHPSARVEDISPTLVRRFLYDIGSDLVSSASAYDDIKVYEILHITAPVNSHAVPRNIGLLFFNEDPDRFFSGARVEVVQFGDDAGGDLIEERVFRGPLPNQIKATLEYLDGLGGAMLQKVAGQAEVQRTVPYPYEAMEEAIVNAVYHRGYDSPPEPSKVYLYPDRMEIVSYPGPVPGVKHEQLQPGGGPPVAPARNRRIGELLKELRLAEARGTGIPKIQRRMAENGSPAARFEFDDDRTFFRVILPVHPRYEVLHALREASHFWAIGEKRQAVAHLQRASERQPGSGAIASQIIEYAFGMHDPDTASETLARFERAVNRTESAQPYLTMARLLIDTKRVREASEVLKRMPPSRTVGETVEAAILKKRAGELEEAHHLFAEAYSLNPDDPKTVHEFAQTKIALARELGRARRDRLGRNSRNRSSNIETRRRLNKEAAELLRRAIALSDDSARSAWCWYDLARTLEWLRQPRSEIEAAFLRAITLMPDEGRFTEAYSHWKTG